MSIFKKIRETYFETVNMLQQIRQDKEYFKIFVRTINEECADPKSEFVKMGLKVGDDGESIVYLTGVPEEFQSSGRDYMILDKLNENTYFVTDFLKKIWRGDNYISVPEFYHIEDPAFYRHRRFGHGRAFYVKRRNDSETAFREFVHIAAGLYPARIRCADNVR